MAKLTFCKLMRVSVGRIQVSVQKEIQNIIKHFNPANLIFYTVLTFHSIILEFTWEKSENLKPLILQIFIIHPLVRLAFVSL